MNILDRANQIVNMRSEEKERMYGPFSESMEKAAELFNIISKNSMTAEDMYLALIALKLSRESYAHKEDNLLDACAYIGGLNNYINEKNGPSAIGEYVKFYKTKPVKDPVIGTGGSAGIDFFIPDDFEETVLKPGEDSNINLGIITEFEPSYVLIAFNKSGISTKFKLLRGACVIDSDYRGEIHAHMINVGTEPVTLKAGMKIVQFILLPFVKPELIELKEKPGADTERGANGFGSTGI